MKVVMLLSPSSRRQTHPIVLVEPSGIKDLPIWKGTQSQHRQGNVHLMQPYIEVGQDAVHSKGVLVLLGPLEECALLLRLGGGVDKNRHHLWRDGPLVDGLHDRLVPAVYCIRSVWPRRLHRRNPAYSHR